MMDRPRLKPLYPRVFGHAFERMPSTIQALHRPDGVTRFKGVAHIDKARNLAGTLAAKLFRFPPPGADVPVEVELEPRGNREIWRRRFGQSAFSSTLAAGEGAHHLSERFGLVTCLLDVECHEQGLDMRIRSARVGILPLPGFLVPWTRAFERVDDEGRFTFDVEVGLPGIGRLVRYRGWLRAKL